MKPRTQIILVGALLAGVAALSSVKRGARHDNASQSRGACCPFMPTLDGMPLPSVTNGKTINSNFVTPPGTNFTTSHKQQ